MKPSPEPPLVERPPSPDDWAIGASKPGMAGWSGRSQSVTIRAGEGPLMTACSVRAAGSCVALWANAPQIWANVITVQLFAVTGKLKASIVGPIPVLVGSSQVFNLIDVVGACDSLELQVANIPPNVLNPLVGDLTLSLLCYDQGQGFWDARFRAILEILMGHKP